MKRWRHVIAAVLLVGMAVSAATEKEVTAFFARCRQLEKKMEGQQLASVLKTAPAEARASYRYLYFLTVSLFLNHQSTEAHKQADLTLRTVMAKEPEDTILLVQENLQAWSMWDLERTQPSPDYDYTQPGGYSRFTLSTEEDEARSKDILSVLARKADTPSKKPEPDALGTYWGTTPESSWAQINASYQNQFDLPLAPSSPQTAELPAEQSPEAPPK